MNRADQLKLLQAFLPKDLPAESWQEFSAIWAAFDVPRKTTITAAGEVENYLYFVCSGAQRVVHFHPDGREATLLFTYTQSFGGIVDSFLLQKPSKFYFESLSKSQFLRTSFSRLQRVKESQPWLQQFLEAATASALSGLLQRMVELQCMSNTEKLQALLQRSPHILKHVPHKYLASYLGMDASNFSELLNSVRFT